MLIRKPQIEGIVTVQEGVLTPFEPPSTTSIEGLIEEEQTRAFARGKEEGEKQGYEKARQEMGALTQLLHTVAGKFLEQKEHLLEELKPEIFELSLAICEQVIRRELADPEKLTHLIDAHLESVSGMLSEGNVSLFLAPRDASRIKAHVKEEKGVRVLVDPLLREGDCRIESKTRLLNATIQRSLEEIRERLLQ